MNTNRYRLVFSKILGMLVPVSEITTSNRKSASGMTAASGAATPTAPPSQLMFVNKKYSQIFLAVMAVLNTGLFSPLSYAVGTLPTNGVVVNGSGGIAVNGQTMTIQQNTAVMGINWSTFNIGSGNSVIFQQPNASAVAINKILGNSASSIYGQLQSNGQVFLLNPNGVLFGKNSQVNVGSFVASTAQNISQDTNGHWVLSNMGPGSVINQGAIKAANGGFVVLAGAQITNQGTIDAQQGSVALTAGQTVTLSVDSGRLINVNINEGTLKALVDNQGIILADGGSVYLTASGVNTLLNTVVNNEGVIEARSLNQVNGRVILRGDGGDVISRGQIDVSGKNIGESGGQVILSGDRVGLFDAAKIDASGFSQGGTVIIGGDKLHKLIDVMDVPLANQTMIANGTLIDISSSHGDGGYVETSGKRLSMQGQIDAQAAHAAGQWLIDPTDITIGSTVSTASNTSNTWTGTNVTDTVNNASIASALNAGTNVLVTTASGNTSLGNITVAANIASNGSGNLTLTANNNININAAINLTGSSGSNLTLNGVNVTNNVAGTINTSGGVFFNTTGSGSNLSGVISGSGGITNQGNGTVVLSAANTYTGATNVVNGNLTWSGNPYFNIGRTTNISSNATFNLLNSNNNLSGPIPVSTIIGNGTFRLDGTTLINQTSNTNGSGYSGYLNVAMSSGGLIDLEGNSKIINGGYQLINWTNNNASMFIAANATLDMWDGTAIYVDALTGSGSIVKSFIGGGSFPNNTNLTIGVANGSGTFSGVIGGGVGNNQLNLVKVGTGTEVLTGANTYAGSTTVLNGNLTWSGNSYFNVGRTTNIASGAVFDLLNSNNSLAGVFPNSTIIGAGTLKFEGNSTLNQVSGGVPNQVNINIAMAAGGLIDLEGTSRITNGGWQFINWANNNASMCISASSNLDIWDGNQVYVDALNGSGTILRGTAGAQTINLTIGVANGSGVFSGKIYGGSNTSAIGIIKVGTGTQIFSGTEGYGGITYINQGILQIGNGATNGSINITPLIVNNATLVYNTTSNVVLQNITGTGNVIINTSGGNANITQNTGTALNYSGTTTVQSGTGNVTLTNANNSLSGQVGVISAGTVNISNNVALNMAAVNASGPIALTTQSGNLTLNGNIQTTTGNVTLTAGANSGVAATSVSNGNVTGGDVVKGSATSVAAGSTGTVIIYSGNANSTLQNLVTNGTNSFYESYATSAGNGSVNTSRAINIFDRVSPVLTITNATASNKIYDSTNLAIVNGNITGAINGDAVTNSAQATFSSAAVGNAIAVNTSGTTIGVVTGNPNQTITGYQFGSAPTGLTANIGKAQVTVSSVVVNNKIYDTTTNASINSTAATVAFGNSSAANGSTISQSFSNFTETASFANASAGSSKTVNLNAVLADTANYTIISQPTTTTANISQAQVTISGVSANNKIYDTTTNASLNISSALVNVSMGNSTSANGNSTTTSNPTLLSNSSSAVFSNAGVGTQNVTINAVLTDATNYSVSSINNMTAVNGTVTGATTGVISKANVTISSVVVNNKVYDGTTNASLNTSSATVALGNASAANGSVVSQAFTNFTETVSFANATAGSAKVVNVNGTLTDTSNYTIASQPTTTSANISQAQVTITGVTANSKVYDATTNVNLSSVTAIVGLGNSSVANGSTVSQAFTNFTESGSFSNASAGTNKVINLNAALTDATNYTIVSQPLTTIANINQAQVTINALTVNNKVYDTTTNASFNNATATVAMGNSNAANGSTVSQAFTNFTETASFSNASAGTNKTVNLNATLGDTVNYTISTQPLTATANISKALVNVAGVTASNKVYDGTTNASLNTSATSVVAVMGNSTSANGNTTTVVNGSLLSNAITGSFANASAGMQNVTVNATLSDTTNYTLNSVNGVASTNGSTAIATTAVISKANVTINNVTVSNKVYDGTANASLSGVTASVAIGNSSTANGLTINQAFSGFSESASFANASAGTNKTVNLNAVLTDTANYTIASQPTTSLANIAQAQVIISSVGVNNKVYDTTANASINNVTATVALGNASLANGSTSSQAFSNFTENASFINASAGANKSVSLNATLADTTNYTIASQVLTTSANISKAQVTISNVSVSNKTYDASTVANVSGSTIQTSLGNSTSANGNLSAPVTNSSLVTVSGVFSNASAGNQSVVLTNVLNDTTNYSLAAGTPVTSSAYINKANLTAYVNNDAKFVTQLDNTSYSGVSYAGFVGGQNISTSDISGGVISRTNSAVQSAGVYNSVLTLSGANSNNYSISTVSGNFTIVPASQLLVKVGSSSSIYGDTQNISVTSAQYLSSNNSVISNLTLVNQSGNTFNYTDGAGGQAIFRLGALNSVNSTSGNLQVGAYQVGATNITTTSNNFSNNLVVVGGGMMVTQKPLTLNTSGVTKTYDGTVSTGNVSLNMLGLVSGDDVLAFGVGSYLSKNAGSNLSYAIASSNISGADSQNYYIANPASQVTPITSITGVINKANISSVSGITANNKVYDQTTNASLNTSAAVFVGEISGDFLTVNSSIGQFSNAT